MAHPYNVYPLAPHLYSKTEVYRGYTFSFFFSKTRIEGICETFLTKVFLINQKKYQNCHLTSFNFNSCKKICVLHGYVLVMLLSDIILVGGLKITMIT